MKPQIQEYPGHQSALDDMLIEQAQNDPCRDMSLNKGKFYLVAQSSGLNSFETMVEERQGTIEDPANRGNETNPILFVYQKDGAIKVLSLKEAKEDAGKLESDCWAHVATLDAKDFVKRNFGKDVEVRKPIRGRRKTDGRKIAAGLEK